MIDQDGNVSAVDHDVLYKLQDEADMNLIGNHVFHPYLLELYAKQIEGWVDEVSLEAAAGRWFFEYLDMEPEQI